jgi:hypothetical protein
MKNNPHIKKALEDMPDGKDKDKLTKFVDIQTELEDSPFNADKKKRIARAKLLTLLDD